MPRFYVSVGDSETVAVTGSDFNHMKNVLRMSVGETLTLCDGKGMDYSGVIERFGHSEAVVRIISGQVNDSEPDVRVTLYQGIPKTGKMDGIIMKCVELGIYSIVPVITERTVVRFGSESDKAFKRDRWQKIAVEAAKQCNRGIIPEVSLPLNFAAAIGETHSYDRAIMPYENEKRLRLSEYLSCSPIVPHSQVSIYIGPEGGFSDGEAAKATENGAVHVSLGSRILRTETAGMAVLSVIMSSVGEM